MSEMSGIKRDLGKLVGAFAVFLSATLVLAIVSVSMVLLFGCKDHVDFGKTSVPCVGLDYEGANPDYVYKVSTRNAVMAGIFSPTIIVPIVVLNNELFCPVALKPLTK